MPLDEQQRTHLLAVLESRGWQWGEGIIYAPHATMWLLGAQPWVGDLHEFCERMSGRLQRNEQAGWMYEHVSDHQNLVADTRSLVDALAEELLIVRGVSLLMSNADPGPAEDRPRE